MKKLIFLIVLILFAIIGETKSQSWQEMMDSCNAFQQARDYQTALKWALQAEVKAKAEFGEMDTNYVKTLEKIGAIYYYSGDAASALKYCEICLLKNKQIYKGDHPDVALSLNNLAVLYQDQGRLGDAEPLKKEALEMYRRLFKGDHPDVAWSLNYLASLYQDQGRLGDAEPLAKEALEMRRRLFRGDHPDVAGSLNSLASLYRDQGRLGEAEPLYTEALEMKRRLFKGDHPYLAGCLNNLASLNKAQGRLGDAEPLYKEALEMYRRLFKGDHPNVALSLYNLAQLYQAQGRLGEAEPLFKEGLEMYKNIYIKQSINLSEKEKEQYWNTMNFNFEGFYTFVLERIKENPAILGYSFDNLLFTKALLFNSANKIKKRILESNDSLLIFKYREFSSKKDMLIKLYSLPSIEVKKHGINIDSLEKRANELEKELSLKSEAFKQSYEKKKVSWRTIQAILKPDEVAIEMVRFWLKDKKRWTDTIYYAALIVTEQTTENPDIVILKNGKELEDKYYTLYRNSVKMKGNDSESFKMFWQKVYEKTKDYKKVYFSPDGIYNKLNIGTFQVGPGRYLLDFQEIHQLNSTQDILLGFYSKQQETNVYSSAVLIGNPDFTLSQDKVKEKERSLLREREAEERGGIPSRSFVLSSLPGTEKEVENIAKYLKSKKWDIFKFTKADAVKAAVKSANNPRVLHIATHGLFLSDIKPDEKEIFGMETKRMIGNPLLRSGLFFAGASSKIDESFSPSGNDNGFLTAYEAMNLNLDKTELVVLSACETGLGEIKNGEGVYGLQRAFIQAGAKTIIMSLWSVSDEATQELMSTFYKEWLGGKTKREAFHYAQMKLKEKYPAPYFWGAFVMVGE